MEDPPKEQKMANRPQKIKLCKDLAMYFAEKGKILTQIEYNEQSDKPINMHGIRNVGRSYSHAVEMTKRAHPELLKMTEKKKEPAPVIPKPVPQVPKPAVKPAPKAAVKPAPKPAVIEGKDDEQNL